MTRNALFDAQPPALFWRLAVPTAALGAFCVVVLLWAAGLQSAIAAALRFFGVEPGVIPFLDIHAVLAAAECQRAGIDVYAAYLPCDVLGRPHVYSPLWLPVIPPLLGTAATPWVGILLDLLCLASLPLLMRISGWRATAIMAAAVFSPAIMYGLERSNNDLIVFLMVLAAGLLLGAAPRRRLLSYALIIFAALLKYYPAVLLVLIARERRRAAMLLLAGAAAALAVFAASFHDVLPLAFANIPVLSYYTDSFSARNLPFGLATAMPQLQWTTPVAIVLLAILSIFAVARLRRTTRLLETVDVDWTSREMRFAAIGGLLLTGCFFAGQNVNYRCIYFLFVLPGVLQLLAGAKTAPARRFLWLILAAILFALWQEFFRRALLEAFGAQPGDSIAMVFWMCRELVWWWLVAMLAAIAACFVARLPLIRDAEAGLARLGEALRTVRGRMQLERR